jgi:uncharacterized protein
VIAAPLDRRSAMAGGAAFVGALLAPVPAAADLYLYEGRTIVTGQREETRAPAFAACLRDVLVKVSGDPRLADDPRAAELASRAGDLVDSFRYRDLMAGRQVHDEQGTRDRPYELTVAFDPAEIDAALRSLGREPWTAERPRVGVVLTVRDPGATFVLASDGERGSGQRAALAAAAERRGLPVVLPSRAALAAADADPGALGADAALVGSMAWRDDPPGWTADWRLTGQGEAVAWRTSNDTFDEAFREALGGAAQVLSGNGRPD